MNSVFINLYQNIIFCTTYFLGGGMLLTPFRRPSTLLCHFYTTLPSIGFLKAGKLATKRRLTFTFLISRRRVCLSVLFRVFFSTLQYIQRTLKLVLKSFNHSESDTFSIREPMMKLVRSKTSHVYFISVVSCKCTIPVVTFFNIFDFRLLAPTEWCSSAAWTHTDWKVI